MISPILGDHVVPIATDIKLNLVNMVRTALRNASYNGVRLQVQDKYVTIDNGILQLTLSKPRGMVTGIKYNGVDNLMEVSNKEDDRGFIMLRGSSGFYSYGIYEHLEGWPDFDMIKTRIVFKIDTRSHTFKVTVLPFKNSLKEMEGKLEIVAEGTVVSTSSDCLVHFRKLGPDGWKVWIDVAVDPEAFLWRPNSEMSTIGEAVGALVAWYKEFIVFD